MYSHGQVQKRMSGILENSDGRKKFNKSPREKRTVKFQIEEKPKEEEKEKA